MNRVVPSEVEEIARGVSRVLESYKNHFPGAEPKVDVHVKNVARPYWFKEFWLDKDKSYSTLVISGFIHPIRKKDTQSTSIEFYFRPENPAMAVAWFALLPELRGQGKGRTLLECMESISEELNCNDNLFIRNVTNKEFWNYHNYKPFVESKHGAYWKK